jgi:hypothetical protein
MTPFTFIGKEVERKAQEGEDICIGLPLARSELTNTGLICNGDESVVEHAYYRSARRVGSFRVLGHSKRIPWPRATYFFGRDSGGTKPARR